MAPYLAHVSRERARIRHQALADPQAQAQVFEFLKGEAGIAGIKPGRNSFLLLLEPEADLGQICAHLETAFPALGARGDAAQGEAPVPVSVRPKAHSGRKCKLLTMLTFGLTTVGLAFTGFKHAHALAGGIFALLATDHVWERRKAL
ncbi:MAG: hypothetical protein K2J64_05265 [Desulfovibrio sp.]|nr:hypothetical protein [Desulfovibrio sp.]